MKLKLQISLLMLTGAIFGCDKLAVDSPTIDIALSHDEMVADTFVYRLGDTVSFRINGTAGNLAFYPGTAGYNYDNRNRTLLEEVNPVLTFTSQMQWGNQANTLRILAINSLASTDSATIVNSNWTDVTDRAVLPASSTTIASGGINLRDVADSPSDTLYIAFKYSGTTGSTQRTWTITNYALNNVLASGTVGITTIANEASYWNIFGKVGTGNVWTASSTQLNIVGGAATAPTRDCWIVSRPMVVGSVANDYSIAVKNVANADVEQYDYVYATTGTFKAVWHAFNNTSEKQESVLKTFYIKIIE